MTSQPVTRVPVLPCTGTYRIDSALSALTSSRHMFGLGKVHAGSSMASGQLEVGGSAADCQVTATIAAASFASGNAKRDHDVIGPGLLDVAGFSLIGFTSTEMREGERGMVLIGSVAMHGLTVSVQLLVSAWKASAPDRIRVLARAEHLDCYSFGITGAKGWVGRYFDLDFFVAAARTVRN